MTVKVSIERPPNVVRFVREANRYMIGLKCTAALLWPDHLVFFAWFKFTIGLIFRSHWCASIQEKSGAKSTFSS